MTAALGLACAIGFFRSSAHGVPYDRFVVRPELEIEQCRIAHRQLLTVVAGLNDTDVRRPSRLPAWSIGHVLTHLARNGEAMCRRIQGAMRHEMVDQYVGGPSGRQAEIERGSARSATDLKHDVEHWSVALDGLFESAPDDVWDRPVRTVAGGEHRVGLLPLRRWREVEVHLVDLGIGFGPADWSHELVRRMLPGLLADLADRTDQRALMAWALGRGPAPDLGSWG